MGRWVTVLGRKSAWPGSSFLGVSEGLPLTGLSRHFQVAKEEWSQTLWINLNVQFLQEGIEGFLKALRKLPRQVRNLAVARFLEAKMKAFKDALPLLLDLKHEALRDRFVSSSVSHRESVGGARRLNLAFAQTR